MAMITIGASINYEDNDMDKLLETSLYTYIYLTIFIGVIVGLLLINLFWQTKKINTKWIKISVRTTICGVLLGFWTYFFVYRNLYPVSLAYYENKNNLTVDVVGVVESINLVRKDRLYVNIDGTVYVMVYSSQKPYNSITADLVKGKTVYLRVGKHSMYILGQAADFPS